MEKDLPKVTFDNKTEFGIEVMNFDQLLSRLKGSKSHNPFAPHKIEFYLILIITKASYTHYVDFKSYELKEGNVLFLAKNQIHRFTEALKEAAGISIVFSKLFVDKHYFLTEHYKFNRLFNYHIESPLIHQSQINGENLIDLATKLHEEFTFPNSFAKPEILASLLRVLLLKAERAKESHAPTNTNLHWLNIFNSFIELLETDYTNSRNSKEYAAKLYISYKLLNKIVKKLTGKTVKAFIDDYVTLEIKRLLISATLSIKEISYKAGFEEPANMIKFFKKNTGTTPLKFRQAK